MFGKIIYRRVIEKKNYVQNPNLFILEMHKTILSIEYENAKYNERVWGLLYNFEAARASKGSEISRKENTSW